MSSLNPTRYWVNYTDDERQLIIGYYNDDAYKEENVPTPNMEITESVWNKALDEGANKVDESNNLVVGDAGISVYDTTTGEILRTLYFLDDPELEVNEAVVNGSYDPDAEWVNISNNNTVESRPYSTVSVNINNVNIDSDVIFYDTVIGNQMMLYAKSEDMINVYILLDDYIAENPYALIDVEDTQLTLQWPSAGVIDVKIVGDFPTRDFNTTITVTE